MNQEKLFKALKEVDVILKHTDSKLVSKVPKKFLEFMQEMKDESYEFKINPKKSLEEQDMMYETVLILSIILKNSWSNSTEIQNFLKNHNVDNAQFKEDQQKQIKEINDQIKSLAIVKKENIFKKAFKRIKTFFTSRKGRA